MSEHGDDTTERDAPSPGRSEPEPGSYYYDDGTGYEIYDPSKDDEEDGAGDEPADDDGKDDRQAMNRAGGYRRSLMESHKFARTIGA
jgi:hypothetical protein